MKVSKFKAIAKRVRDQDKLDADRWRFCEEHGFPKQKLVHFSWPITGPGVWRWYHPAMEPCPFESANAATNAAMRQKGWC